MFASILIPLLALMANDADPQRCHDESLAIRVTLKSTGVTVSRQPTLFLRITNTGKEFVWLESPSVSFTFNSRTQIRSKDSFTHSRPGVFGLDPHGSLTIPLPARALAGNGVTAVVQAGVSRQPSWHPRWSTSAQAKMDFVRLPDTATEQYTCLRRDDVPYQEQTILGRDRSCFLLHAPSDSWLSSVFGRPGAVLELLHQKISGTKKLRDSRPAARVLKWHGVNHQQSRRPQGHWLQADERKIIVRMGPWFSTTTLRLERYDKTPPKAGSERFWLRGFAEHRTDAGAQPQSMLPVVLQGIPCAWPDDPSKWKAWRNDLEKSQ